MSEAHEIKAAEGMPWPADHVERWPIDRLLPNARNARTHSDAQVAMIANSIKQWGWTIPVLVDDEGVLIAGHGRIMAAKTLDITEVPVMVARGWTDAQKRAYMLADNQLATKSAWDLDRLRAELADLQGGGLDLGIAGFELIEIEQLLGNGADPAEEWNGMPEFRQQDQTAFRSLIVHFKTQEAVDAFAKLVQQTISPQTKYLWYPFEPEKVYMDKRYVGSPAEVPALHPEQGTVG